ncbi:MAG: crossover junction endodeoxyribonuclease RuvC [Proteobacteria bacterium]|nr:MAG: crossover junction endodeoxyribonuclease RuvC [Alphaproteobacteria bacterium]RZA13746.1 MAG: crossover junction endodeoxyribonuclease RuvC [Pseudomonadota bacterium]
MAETIILGIDPGLEHTGYGVIAVSGNSHRFIAAGRVSTSPTLPLPQRLAKIAEGLALVIKQHNPTHAAVEEVFVNSNARSSLKLGQARGVSLLVPTQHGLPVAEYAARLVKQSIVGKGNAEKTQVAHMVKVLLPASAATSADAADALAVALTHAHHLSFQRVLTK